jgi:tetratricopeptide (TPR) repeat protein
MVVGETGIGKSRLIEEFENWIDLRPELVMFFKGRAWLEARHLARGLLRDVLAFRFQIQENEQVSDVWEKIEQGIRASRDSWDDESWKKRAHIIGQWLGFDFGNSPFVQQSEAQRLSDNALNYLAEYFTAVTAKTPALVILEDVHWADESSLHALTDFASRLRGIPLMVVIITRPQLLERRADWDFRNDYFTRLDLRGLSNQASEELVRNILIKAPNIPEQLFSLIIENSAGNPFYIEEIIKSLVEDGVIIKGDDHWHIDDVRLKLVQIPASLTAILQARLDSLPAVEREALQQASVLGKVFWDRALTFISRKSSSDETSQILSRLTRKELILRGKTSAFLGSKEYIFRHAILHQVTYESVLIRQRQTYHGFVAEWLMDQSGDRSSEYSGQIAYHLVQAGKSDDALPYLRRAGIDAAKRFAHDEAITFMTQALEILPADDIAEQFELLLVREASYHARGQRAEQEVDLDRLSLLSLKLNLDQQAHVSLRRSRFLELTGNYLGSIRSAQTGVALAQGAANVELMAEGHWLWGSGLRRQSNYEEAERELGRGVELGEACGSMSIVAACLRGLGSIAWNQGKFSEAKQYINKSLTITRNTGEKRGEINSLTYLGLIARGLHEFTLARDALEEAVKLSKAVSDRRGEGWSQGNLGLVLMDIGNFQRASDDIGRAISIFQDIDDEGGEAIFLARLAVMAHRRGQREKAEKQFNRALDLFRHIGHQHGEARALHDKGYFHLHHNELDKAQSCFQKSLGIRSRINQTRLLIEDQVGIAAVSLARGDLSKALLQIEPVLNQIDLNPKLRGFEYPFEVFASSLKILLHARHPRTDIIRDLAQRCLEKQVKRMTSSEQEIFLENVPYYKELTSIIESAQI